MRGAHDTGVQHARQFHVVQEAVTAGYDFRQAERGDFLTHDPVGFGILDVDIRVHIDTERFVALDFPIGDAAVRIP